MELISPLKDLVTIEILNVKVDMYYNHNDNQQVHFIVHMPDYMTLNEKMMHNIIGSLVMPFGKSARILEVYLYQGENNYKSMLFASLIEKVARQHRISMQGRAPHMEKTFSLEARDIKRCVCNYCVKQRDSKVYNTGAWGPAKNEDLN